MTKTIYINDKPFSIKWKSRISYSDLVCLYFEGIASKQSLNNEKLWEISYYENNLKYDGNLKYGDIIIMKNDMRFKLR